MATLEGRIAALEPQRGAQGKMGDMLLYLDAVEKGKDITPWQGLNWNEVGDFLDSLD